MKRNLIITIVTVTILLLFTGAYRMLEINTSDPDHVVKVGYIYDGDESAPYTANFIRAQHAIEKKYEGRVESVVRSNVPAASGPEMLSELVAEGCEIIFTTSYGYQEAAKECAAANPNVQICEATGDMANTDPVLSNYHNFMGRIYEGRYAAGVVAGMKLRQMIDEKVIKPEEAKVGYVAAYPYSEVISGYTAYLMGVRSVVSQAVMHVCYTGSWSSYALEKSAAQHLIDEGCVILSQHTDTIGPAIACEQAFEEHPVYFVGYNQSMSEVAPAASLITFRICWEPYVLGAVDAVFKDEEIESVVQGKIHGTDMSAGFDKGWVEMDDLNELAAAPGTEDAMKDAIERFKRGNGDFVYRGNYTGVNPDDPSDTIDLRKGYIENANTSYPLFHYILTDIITVDDEYNGITG